MNNYEEYEDLRKDESIIVWLITNNFFGQNKIIKGFKDKQGVIFRPYASGGFSEFDESDILFIASSREELEELAPEYFI